MLIDNEKLQEKIDKIKAEGYAITIDTYNMVFNSEDDTPTSLDESVPDSPATEGHRSYRIVAYKPSNPYDRVEVEGSTELAAKLKLLQAFFM